MRSQMKCDLKKKKLRKKGYFKRRIKLEFKVGIVVSQLFFQHLDAEESPH